MCIRDRAPALRCGGSLTGCASSMSCRSFKIRNSTARAVFSTMASGSGKSRPLHNSGCGGPSWRPWRKSQPTFRRSCGLWTVSYTHLDVYKRQIQRPWNMRTSIIPWHPPRIRLQSLAAGAHFSTTLTAPCRSSFPDVYKRQPVVSRKATVKITSGWAGN